MVGVRDEAHILGKGAVGSECAIPHFNYSKTVRNCWLVITLVHVLAKNAKPLKPLLEVGGGNGRGTYERQSCSEKFVSVIPHFNLTEIIRDGWFVITFIQVSAKMQNR